MRVFYCERLVFFRLGGSEFNIAVTWSLVGVDLNFYLGRRK